MTCLRRTAPRCLLLPRLSPVCLAAALALATVTACATPAKVPAKVAVRAAQEPLDIVTYGAREDVVAFADDLARRRGLDAAWVRDKLGQARFLPSVAKAIMPPPVGVPKNWAAYRARFIEPRRIRAGLEFWQAHEKWLQRAEEMYGVPPEIVVGIIGVETLYGRHMGSFRILDALATLSFDFPSGRSDRSGFFRDELEQVFVLSHSEGIDPLSLRGSYAGAMGMPQFMPSSWNKYAVDFDGDSHVDLHGNPADVIGSVAHYLAEFGWQRGQPTHFEVTAPLDPQDRAVLLGPDILPTFTAADFAERRAGLSTEGAAFEGKLALVELQNGSQPASYVAGTSNFYVVTRYNWSSYYALAVIELGQAVGRLARR